jgi:hypothetical protein
MQKATVPDPKKKKNWLRRLDLNQRSGSCRIMSLPAANLSSNKNLYRGLVVLTGSPAFSRNFETAACSAMQCSKDRVL